MKIVSFNQYYSKESESRSANTTSAIEAMNKIKTMFQSHPQKTMNAQSNNIPKRVIQLLR